MKRTSNKVEIARREVRLAEAKLRIAKRNLRNLRESYDDYSIYDGEELNDAGYPVETEEEAEWRRSMADSMMATLRSRKAAKYEAARRRKSKSLNEKAIVGNGPLKEFDDFDDILDQFGEVKLSDFFRKNCRLTSKQSAKWASYDNSGNDGDLSAKVSDVDPLELEDFLNDVGLVTSVYL
jgi:hypothetical protein